MTETENRIDAKGLLDGATEGPWDVGSRSGADNTLAIIPASGYAQRLAAVCPCPHYDNRQSDNAALIAAAPTLAARVVELEAALRGVLENCALIHKHWGANSNATAAKVAEDTARAALTETA